MKQWYALHTRPYSERKVSIRLDRHDDIETYVPEAPNDSDRSDTRTVPFFPGYMFVRLDMDKANPTHWRFTPGVRYIVSQGDTPIALDEDLIQTIQKQLAALKARSRQPRTRFQQGDRVRITSGPLQDLVGIFDGPSEPAERVHILLEVMSRYKRIRIPESDLEKASLNEERSRGKRPRRTRGRGRRIRS